jgi:protein-disulfide isomerase
LSALRKQYKQDLKIVHVPVWVHKHLSDAAIAGCVAAKQGRYQQMSDALWAHYDAKPRPAIREIAARAGLSLRRWDVQSEACAKSIQKNWAAYRPLGVRGTPTAYINGRRINGARPIEAFQKIIDEELATANAAVRSKADLRKYYGKTVLSQPIP